jgi:hypothetical protein
MSKGDLYNVKSILKTVMYMGPKGFIIELRGLLELAVGRKETVSISINVTTALLLKAQYIQTTTSVVNNYVQQKSNTG